MAFPEWLASLRRFEAKQPDAGADAAGAAPDTEDTEPPDDEPADDDDADSETDEDEESAEESQTTLRKLLAEKGFDDLDGEDDVSLVNQLMERAAKAKQVAELEQQNAQMRNFLAWQQHNQVPQQPQPQQPFRYPDGSQLAHWNSVPEFNQEWMNFVTEDDHGNMIAKPGAQPDLPQKIQQYQQWQQTAARNILQNFPQVAPMAVLGSPQFQQLLQQRDAALIEQVRSEIVRTNIAQVVSPYAFDNNGNPTEWGRTYAERIHELEQSGVRDPVRAHGIAFQLANSLHPQTSGAPAKPANRQRDLLKSRNTRRGNATGTTESASKPKKPRQNGRVNDFQTMLAQNFKAGGYVDDDDL